MAELLFIPGSLREQSASKALTQALVSRLSGACGTSIAEIGHLPHFNSDIPPDGAIEVFLKKIADADGVVIVTPECPGRSEKRNRLGVPPCHELGLQR